MAEKAKMAEKTKMTEKPDMAENLTWIFSSNFEEIYSRLPNKRNVTINFLEKFVCHYELIREYYDYRFFRGAFLKFSNITNLNRDWCLSVVCNTNTSDKMLDLLIVTHSYS